MLRFLHLVIETAGIKRIVLIVHGKAVHENNLLWFDIALKIEISKSPQS